MALPLSLIPGSFECQRRSLLCLISYLFPYKLALPVLVVFRSYVYEILFYSLCCKLVGKLSTQSLTGVSSGSRIEPFFFTIELVRFKVRSKAGRKWETTKKISTLVISPVRYPRAYSMCRFYPPLPVRRLQEFHVLKVFSLGQAGNARYNFSPIFYTFWLLIIGGDNSVLI